MTIIGPFIAFAFLAAVLFYAGQKRVQRKAACFALYKVRDDLVCLVAEDKLKEESRVFQHYYERANRVLATTPNVGFDHVLEALISQRKNHDLARNIERSRRTLDELQKLPEMQHAEVRQVVADFYAAVGQVMIAHSSLSRFMFLSLMHEKVLPVLDKLTPRFSKELRLAKFAVEESNALSPAHA